MIRRPVFWLTVLALASCATGAARADSWVFNPSYYTHDPSTKVRIGRQYSTGPVYARPQGESVSSGFRYYRSNIQIKGQTYDNINLYQSWIQFGAQY